jgi:hypothetical protein
MPQKPKAVFGNALLGHYTGRIQQVENGRVTKTETYRIVEPSATFDTVRDLIMSTLTREYGRAGDKGAGGPRS